MKRILISLLLIASPLFANEPTTVNKSSAIAVANGTGYISAMYLDKVVIGVATANGVMELYNSTFTTSVMISSISLATVRYVDFENTYVKGLFWHVATNTNGVTIIYKSSQQ